MAWPFDTVGTPPFGTDTTDYRRQTLGYDPKAALWAQLASALQQAGASIATAPRGQAVGQGLLGVLQGTREGLGNYESGLLDKYKWKQLAQEDARKQAMRDSLAPLGGAPAAPVNPVPFNTTFDAAGITNQPAGDSGSDATANPNDPFADLPTNVRLTAYNHFKQGDEDGAWKIIDEYRLKGGPQLPGRVGELDAAIARGYVPPGTTLDEFARIGQDPSAPIIKDFIQGNQTVQKQWNPATKTWDQVGAGPRFAPTQAPQPSDFQRKLDEVAKIYAPGSKEYNDAVLNITGAAKSQGMSVTTNPDGSMTINWGNKAPTGEQAMASGFYNRATTSKAIVDEIMNSGYKPDLVTNTALGLPGGVGNVMVSDTTQKLQQAKMNIATAILRKESGAVISSDEFATFDKQYFPQPGDSPDVVKQKAVSLQQAIDALKLASGPAADMSAPPPSNNDPLGIR